MIRSLLGVAALLVAPSVVAACPPVQLLAAPQAVYAAPLVAQPIVSAPLVYQPHVVQQLVAQPVSYAVTAAIVQQPLIFKQRRQFRTPVRSSLQAFGRPRCR